MAQFRAGKTMEMVWNGLELIRNGGSSELGFCVRTFERSSERSNVGTCGRMADDQRLNVPPERSNVGTFWRVVWDIQKFEFTP